MDKKGLVTIDKDSLDFLYAIYFGAFNDVYDAATSRAYRDLNRTIRYNGMSDEKRKLLRADVSNLIKNAINEIKTLDFIDQNIFDTWHKLLSDEIIGKYQEQGINFSYGQAQKWINMTLKYLYIIEPIQVEMLFQYCHVPLDNYVFEISEKIFGIKKPSVPWSRWSDYNNQYMEYQKSLRNSIKNIAPLRWEFRAWLQEARGVQEGM